MKNVFKKFENGFTLAEVLITLVVIGVVASLTIPTAINKFKERTTIEKIKSSYAILSTAYRLAQMENGYKFSEWNCDNFENFSNASKTSNCMTYYIKKHLSRVKDCEIGKGYHPIKTCFDVDDGNSYSIDGVDMGAFDSGAGDMFILSNGVPVAIRRKNFMYIKTDNSNKLIFNKNFFFFFIYDDDRGLMPYNNDENAWGCWSSTNKDNIRKGLISGCSQSAIEWIFTKGNMDYLR